MGMTLGSSKRVFILGAGFSKPSGFPLATELTDEVLARIRRLVGSDYELFSLADSIQKLHQWLRGRGSVSQINIEEFFDYASHVAERFRFEHHLEEVGRTAGETAYDLAESIETWLSYMSDHLLEVLVHHDAKADLDPVRRFVTSLDKGDAIITFNYDRLVERVLHERRADWTLGFEETMAKAIRVFKMHGSMDWLCFDRCQPIRSNALQKLFSKRDHNRERDSHTRGPVGEQEYDFELWRVKTTKTLKSLIRGRALIQPGHFWGLAGLGPYKRVSKIPGLGRTWDRARQALYSAKEIIIVGFSFSAYDRLSQIEFARVMEGREATKQSPPKVTVIDPALCRRSRRLSPVGRDLSNRIKSVFREFREIPLPHQEVKWT